jgi:peptide/nickel transport system permease protein
VSVSPEVLAPDVLAAPPSRLVAAAAMPRLALVGGLLLLVIVVLGGGAPLFTHWGSTQIDFNSIDTPPGVHGHLLGTDMNGMDVWARTLYGARIDLGVAVASVAIAVAVGGVLGGLIGYVGGWVDELGMRAMDIIQSFPAFVLALVVAALLGRGLFDLIVVLALVSAPSYVRVMRSEVRATREHGYVEAARSAGEPSTSILFRHVIPNSLRPLLVVAPLNCGWSILTLAGLSFLGLGVQIPTAEWGAMISGGSDDLVRNHWWPSVVPGVALFLSVLAFNLLGEGILDARSRDKPQ